MNKKIKIIELLEMFFKKEKMPKRIKVGAFEFEYREELNAYFNINEKSSCEDLLENWFEDARQLNQEVEILEDNTEEIEELHITKNDNGDEALFYTTKQGYITESNISLDLCLANKINELVRAVNKLGKEKE